MKLLKRGLLVLVVLSILFVLVFVLVVGPWPTYAESDFEHAGFYTDALHAIDQAAQESHFTHAPGQLLAGWASKSITPAVSQPLAGYSARPGDKHSIGVRDQVEVRVLALGDGEDRVVLVGADMLIIPPNVAEHVRRQAANRCGLSPSNILLNASHTHCGPGGFAPGWAAEFSAGPYEETMPAFLAGSFVDAIEEACDALEPARLAAGDVDAPHFIRNRARKEGPVDPELNFLRIEQQDGEKCYLVSYNAHPTTFGDDMMRFSGEYPGELVRYIERTENAAAVYLGGAVGSMGPNAPEGPDAESRVVAMGEALAKLVLEHTRALPLQDKFDIASVGVPLGMPPMQMRPFEGNTNWRVSPLLGRVLGLPGEGWLQGVRVGNILFVGLPCDFSGEISREWKTWARDQKCDLWPLSFNGAYCGYFSPDKYYLETPLGYETGLMSWYGPNIEAYFTALFHHLFKALELPKESAA